MNNPQAYAVCAAIAWLSTCFTTLPLLHASDTAIDVSQPDQSGWTVTLENDLVVGEDSRYTNGIGVLYGRGIYKRFTPRNTPGWLYPLVRHSYLNHQDDRGRAIVYALYQGMQTPEDITVPSLQIDDLPYAGLLAVETQLYAANDRVSDRLILTLGVIGPLSLAGEAQQVVHSVIASDDPKGWRHQLRNEPVVRVEAQRGLRLWNTSNPQRMEADVVTLGSIGAGNLLSDVSATAVVRLGKNLSESFPVVSVLPSRQINPIAFTPGFNWDAFVGIKTAYIANDMSADGNTFVDSHSVKLDHSQAQVSLGVSWNVGRWAFTLIGSELRSVRDSDPFGSISVTRRTR